MREPSIFELIAQDKIPSVKLRENEEFMAILDLFPNTKGQTLVIPKQRYNSDISLMPEDVYTRYMLATQHIMTMLKQGLGVKRVGMIVEGEGVNHAHIKLYPMHGLAEESIGNPDKVHEKVRFDTYQGYLTSKMGEQKTQEELVTIANEILSHQ